MIQKADPPGLTFDEPTHTYYLNGRKLISVTQVIETITPPFETERIARRVAEKRGQTPEYWIAEWKRISEEALERGSRLHEHIESMLLSGQPRRVEGVPEQEAWERWWKAACVNLRPLACEFRVASGALGIAGTIDSVFHSKKTDRLHLFDWKTGKEFKHANRWRNLLPPFDDHPDCELSKYSLQVSIYRVILEDEQDIETGDGWIGWHPPGGEDVQMFKAYDLRDRARAWLRSRV